MKHLYFENSLLNVWINVLEMILLKHLGHFQNNLQGTCVQGTNVQDRDKRRNVVRFAARLSH